VRLEKVARFHVRGATKIYRRDCWYSLGGMWDGVGWDTIDEVKANMKGWETRSLSDVSVIHYRVPGAAWGKWLGSTKNGQADYVVGYHPLFLGAKCLRRLFRTPVIVGALGLAFGWISSHWKGLSKIEDPAFVAYVRHQQLRRLIGQSSIWK
jgi:biofilm PGA synthesis N-glycosyltransferase PgaC